MATAWLIVAALLGAAAAAYPPGGGFPQNYGGQGLQPGMGQVGAYPGGAMAYSQPLHGRGFSSQTGGYAGSSYSSPPQSYGIQNQNQGPGFNQGFGQGGYGQQPPYGYGGAPQGGYGGYPGGTGGYANPRLY